jgi:hypothetical protein
MRALNQLLLLVFVLFGAVGYVYLYPRQAGFVTKTDVYRFYVGPNLDRLFAFGGQESATVGYLVEADGDLSYRPASELVPLPAFDGQRFGRGTLVSTGDGARATIALYDDSKLQLEPNSTILLEAPGEGFEVSSITLKVIGGSVTAEKSAASQVDIKVITPRGTVKALTQEKVAVIAPRKVVTADKPDALRNLGAETEEFVGALDKPLAEIERKMEVEKQAKLAELQKQIELSALETEKARIEVAPPLSTPEPAPAPAVAKTEEAVVVPKLLPPSTRRSANRLPASIPAPEAASDSKLEVAALAPETVSSRRRDPSARWTKPPEGNALSEAFYADRKGRGAESKKILARSLTQKSYASNEAFADATRVALDSLLEGYVANGNEKLATQTLKNVEKAYSADPSAVSWAMEWRRKLATSGFDGGPRSPASSKR